MGCSPKVSGQLRLDVYRLLLLQYKYLSRRWIRAEWALVWSIVGSWKVRLVSLALLEV